MPIHESTGKAWRPNGTPRGEVRRGVTFYPRGTRWGWLGFALAGLVAAVLAVAALEFFRAWQDYSSVWVQLATGRDGTLYGLLALLCAAGAGGMGYWAWLLWREQQ